MVKKFIFVLIGAFMLIMLSCSDKKENQKNKDTCLSGFVLIVSLGEEFGKQKHPLLIRVDEADTIFLKYDVEDNLENIEKNGFIFRRDVYFLDTKINAETFYLLKEYIIEHNTHVNKTILNADYNTIKIVFEDQCDSIAYTINKLDTGYFTNMIEHLNVSDEVLKGRLVNFQEVQDRIIDDSNRKK